MKSTIERWKRDFEDDQKASCEQGFTDGREWATEMASFREAKNVAGLRGSVGDLTVSVIWQAANPDLTEAEFWEQACGPDYEGDVNDAYAEGFLRGVGEVYDTLSGHVER